MPRITLDVSAALADRLLVLRDKASMAAGQELTTEQFITRLLSQAAIAQFMDTQRVIRAAEAEAALKTAIAADEAALLAGMD